MLLIISINYLLVLQSLQYWLIIYNRQKYVSTLLSIIILLLLISLYNIYHYLLLLLPMFLSQSLIMRTQNEAAGSRFTLSLPLRQAPLQPSGFWHRGICIFFGTEMQRSTFPLLSQVGRVCAKTFKKTWLGASLPKTS